MLRSYRKILKQSAVDLSISARYWVRSLTNELSGLPPHPKHYSGSNRDYQRFILIAHARSGSSMVLGALKTHPQIFSFNEIFVSGSIDFQIKGYDNHSVELLRLRMKSPDNFLDQYIYSPYKPSIRAVGFKLFPEQIDNTKGLWQWLERNSDVRVIDLCRSNLLATYTSYLIAVKTKTFAIKDESQRKNTRVQIDPKKFLAEFEKRESYNRKIQNCLRHHSVLKVFYEDVVADPHECFKQMQDFLGVDHQFIETPTIKQQTLPLSEVITNFEDLRQYFSGTDLSKYFE